MRPPTSCCSATTAWRPRASGSTWTPHCARPGSSRTRPRTPGRCCPPSSIRTGSRRATRWRSPRARTWPRSICARAGPRRRCPGPSSPSPGSRGRSTPGLERSISWLACSPIRASCGSTSCRARTRSRSTGVWVGCGWCAASPLTATGSWPPSWVARIPSANAAPRARPAAPRARRSPRAVSSTSRPGARAPRPGHARSCPSWCSSPSPASRSAGRTCWSKLGTGSASPPRPRGTTAATSLRCSMRRWWSPAAGWTRRRGPPIPASSTSCPRSCRSSATGRRPCWTWTAKTWGWFGGRGEPSALPTMATGYGLRATGYGLRHAR